LIFPFLLGLPPGADCLVVGGLPRAEAAFGFGYAEELVLECRLAVPSLILWLRFVLLMPETLDAFTLVEFCFLSFPREFPGLNSV